MKHNLKIGLVSWLGGKNYGTTLQAFALYRFLEKNVGSVKILQKKKTFRMWLYKLKVWLHRSFREFYSLKKINAINCFIAKKFSFSIFSEKKFDTIICGSDQIWHPQHSTDFSLLKVFPSSIKKIAYASSFGVSSLPDSQKERYRNAFVEFSALSCREKTGCDLIQEEFSLHSTWVVDPTFLLTTDEWKNIGKESALKISNEDYILCYFVGSRLDYGELVEQVQKKYSIKKVVLLVYNKAQKKWPFEKIYDAGIEDFIALISNARLVCTDSFHAMAISVNLSKNFLMFMRFNSNEIGSQNSRIFDFMNRLGLESRIFSKKTFDNNELSETIDFLPVQEKLNVWRQESIDYLYKAIGA